MRLIILALMFLNLFLVACAPDKSSTSVIQPTPPIEIPNPKPSNSNSQINNKSEEASSYNWHGDVKQIPSQSTADSNDDFSNLVISSRVDCSGSCPSGVGLLLVYHPSKKVSRCTTFLVEPDVVATNSHCVPDDLKYPGANGKNRLFVIFPHSNAVEVSHVIYASAIDKKDNFVPDYAFLKLNTKALSSLTLPISRNGFKDGANVNIWHISQGPDNFLENTSFILSALSCGVSQNLGLFPMFSSETSPIATLTKCWVAAGDSGSPIIGPDGKVLGILNAYFNIENSSIGQLIAAEDILFIPRIAMAANFSCIRDFSSIPEKMSDACNADMSKKSYADNFKENYKAALQSAGQDLEVQVQELIKKWINENSKIFRWKIVQDESQSKALNEFFQGANLPPSMRPEIDCVQPVDQWKEDYKTMLFFYKSSATVTAKTFIWGIDVGVNSEFKYFPKANSSDYKTLEIQFNPADTIKTGLANVKILSKYKILDSEISLPPVMQELSICK